MNNENTKKYINLPPFKGWVLENFPFIEEDFDAITNYQMMCKIIGYLNVVIKNNDYIQNEEIKPLYDAFVTLKEYVDNYFENLDVQQEVDNKLDEMAESGELAEIIAQYLQVNAVLGFNTKAELKSAENLVDGSIARTIGTDTYNDGNGYYYKIRTITSGDVIDDDLILALSNYPTLIAEKIPATQLDLLKDRVDLIQNTTIPSIINDFDEFKSIYKNNDYIIVLGDSYGIGYGNVTPFTTYLQNNLGLDNDHFITSSVSGVGFVNVAYSKVFIDMLEEITDNLSDEQKNKITKIVIQAGINDRTYTTENIYNAIVNVNNHIKENYPNAKFYLFPCGRSSDPNRNVQIINNVLPAFRQAQAIGVINIINSEFILHDYTLFQADGWHPTEDGQKIIAQCLAQGLDTGTCNVAYLEQDSIQNLVTPAGKLTAFQDVILRTTTTNGISTMILDNRCSFTCNASDKPTLNGGSFKIGEIPNHGIGKRTANILLTFGMIPVHGYVHGTKGGVTADYELNGYLNAYESNGVYELYFRSSFYYYPSANQITDITNGFITAFTFTLDSLRC